MFTKKHFNIKEPKPQGLYLERDDAGVVHVNANKLNDAIWGSGYAHAIDRYTQLLLMRIIGQGRLCELLDDTDENLAVDTFFRRSNWHSALTEEVDKLDQQTKDICQSYCDGVNAGLSTKKISMLKMLGYRPSPWTIEDSILISRMTSYLTLAQSQTEVESFFIEAVQAGTTLEQLKDLFPIDEDSFDRALIDSIELQEKMIPDSLLWNNVIPRMMASNNWVISGTKTASGQPILANDPHLEVNRLPNVWCEQSLNFGHSKVIGMCMPGLPGIIIGRNNHLSWGATYSFMDTVDSWVESCQDGQFKYDDQWVNFKVRQEIIKRKKGPSTCVTFYDNHHGVLSGNPTKTGHYLATGWTGANSGAQSLISCIQMYTATNAKDAMKYLGLVESAWNWVISDIEGNIGYQMSGLMPKRYSGWNGFTPMPGWESKYDWQGFVSLEDLPRSYNPPEGFIVTANQDLNHLGNVSPINMPMGNYRATRISEVIEQRDDHNVAGSKALQFDVYSHQAKEFLQVLLPLLEHNKIDGQAYHVLKQWDCCYQLDSIGAPIFEVFYKALRHEIFGLGNNGLGAKVVEHLSIESGLFIDFYQNFDNVMLNENSAWFAGSSRNEKFINAFQTIGHSKKLAKWSDINTIEFTNILVNKKLPTAFGFCTKPIPLLGGRATPHQGQIYRNAGRATSFSPTIRFISDMKDDYLHTCLAGGPSDNRFSKWYRSGLTAWRNGDYKKLF